MTFSLKHLAAGFSACFLALASHAASIDVTDFSGSETVVELSGAGTPSDGPFSYGGLNISESSTGSGGPGWRNLVSYGAGFTDNAGVSNIVIALGGSFAKAGLDVFVGPATYQVNFFDGGSNLLGSVTRLLPDVDTSSAFAGWESSVGIAKIQIVELNADNGRVGGFNNVRFENTVAVPEPETYAMTLAGMAVLGAIARRRKAK